MTEQNETIFQGDSEHVSGQPMNPKFDRYPSQDTLQQNQARAVNQQGQFVQPQYGQPQAGQSQYGQSQVGQSQPPQQYPVQSQSAQPYSGQPLPPQLYAGQSPYPQGAPGAIPPVQPFNIPRSRQIKPNGKHYFTGRTILYPGIFILVHFILQTVAVVIAMFTALAQSPSIDFMNPESIMEITSEVLIPTLLYSSPLQILTYTIFLWFQKRKNPQYLLMRPNSKLAFPLGIGAAFGGIGLSLLLMALFNYLSSFSPYWQQLLTQYSGTSSGFLQGDIALIILAVSIFVPIAEELLFRGIVTEEIRRVAPDWLAIVIGGVVFALIHGNIIQILYVLPVGLMLSAAYIWTNSIWVPMCIHIVYNFVGTPLTLMLESVPNGTQIYTIVSYAMIPVGIVCMIVMYRIYRKNKPGVPVVNPLNP